MENSKREKLKGHFKTSLGTIVAATLLYAPAVAGGVPGLWTGRGEKDKITDKATSFAVMGDSDSKVDIVLRCRNDGPDILIGAPAPSFVVGDWQDVVVRFGDAPPRTVRAKAVEPSMLVLDVKDDPALFLPFYRPEPIVIRYSGLFGRQHTATFQSTLPSNALSKVGRVVADCGLAPFPEADLKRETDAALAPANEKPSSKPSKK